MQIFLVRLASALLLLIGAICIVIGIVVFVVERPRNAPQFPFGALAAIAVGGGMIYGAFRINRRAKRLAGALPEADNRVGSYLADETETRLLGEREYELLYQPPIQGKGGRASSLVVSVAAASPTDVQFKTEKAFDRFGKRLGIASEHQTGDAEFDDEVYIRTPSPEFASLLLADQESRLAVRALLQHGIQEVRLTGTHVEAVWPGFNPVRDDRPELAEHAAAGLLVLADQASAALHKLEEMSPGEVTSAAAARHKAWLAILWIASIMFAATIAFAFVYPPLRGGELFLGGLQMFVLAYPIFAFITALLLRGMSSSHDHWCPLVLVGVLLVGLGCGGTISGVNALADSAPPQVRKAKILDKREQRGRKGSRSFRVDVQGQDGRGRTSFSVTRREYGRVVPGQSQLELITGKGSLGIEWLKSKRVLP